MKKYRIEIGLSIILFISVVVLIVNIIIKVNNGGKDVTGEEKYTLPLANILISFCTYWESVAKTTKCS